jgi:GT2 family glycosyltransferase
VRETDYVSGCGILIPCGLWEELGGFDEIFTPAYCEDSDLAFRVRAAGKKVYYCPFSSIVHLEGLSQGRDVKTGVKAYQIENT